MTRRDRLIAWLCARLGAHVRGRCGCPVCDTTERDARAAIGMPAAHPEKITRELPGGQEEWLAALAAALWPGDEYAAIITGTLAKGPAVTAAWAAAALLDALRAEVAGVLDDEHASRQHALERAAGKLATVAAAFHAADGELADGEGIEPYCATCGAWIGIFYGLAGWRHFRGDPAPGGQRELYEAGHQAAPAFCPPPGRALCPAQARTAGQALTTRSPTGWNGPAAAAPTAQHGPAGGCPDHVADTGRALAYRQLAAILARALPEMAGEER